MMLCFAVWILIGVTTGYAAAKITRVKAVDLPWYIGLGVLGALVAGWRFANIQFINTASPSLTVYGAFVAFAGAAALLFVYHLLFHSMLERADDQMY